MPSDEIKALSEARFEHAEECLHAAKSLLKEEDLRSAVNRAYYAIFHAMRAVLAYDGIDMKHHSGIMAHFRMLYIKTGVFDKALSDIIAEAFALRTDSDYDDFFVIVQEDVECQVTSAEEFIQNVKAYLAQKAEDGR